MRTHVCLIRPPKLILDGGLDAQVSHTSSTHATAPLGLALIAGSLRSAGYKVTVIDGIGEAPYRMNNIKLDYDSDKLDTKFNIRTVGLTPDEVLARVPSDADIIGISCMFTHNWIADRQLLNFLGEKLDKNITYIAGGESVTGMAEVCLKQALPLTVCALGEGEETVLELVDAIHKKADLNSVNGIMFKLGDEIVKTEKRNRLRTLDTLPTAAWDLFPVENYEIHHNLPEKNNAPTLPILATRGCPYTCTFCTSPDMWGTRYYMRTPENVFNEMVDLNEKYGTISFEFYDLTAIIQKRWILELADLLIKSKTKLYWKIPSGTRSEALDAEVSEALMQSGCYTLTYAPESGSPRLLEAIHKKVKIPKMLDSMRNSKKAGLYLFINMILGLPEETHRDVIHSLIFVAKCGWLGVDEIHLGIFRPYPGTELFKRLVASGDIKFNNDDFLIDTIMCIEEAKSSYNLNVASYWYKLYYPLSLLTFYFFKYLREPFKVFRTISNVKKGTYENRLERHLIYFLGKKSNFRYSG